MVFQRPFSIFLFTPEVDFQYKKFHIMPTIKPKHMPFEFRKSVYWFLGYQQKNFFPSKPEVDFKRQHFSIFSSIKPEHMPFEFRKSVHQFSRYEQKAVSRLDRKQIFSDNNFLSSLPSNLKISRLNFENPSINTQVISQKPVFEGHF